MFDEIARKPDGRRRLRRVAWLTLSAAVQTALVLGLIVIGDRFRAAVTGTERIVDVKFFHAAQPVPGPPPAPAPKRPAPVHARKEPRPAPPATPALVQPKTPSPVPEPSPSPEPPEEEPPAAEGGVVGGAPGGTPQGAPGGAGAEPTFAKAGYRLPRLAEGTCLQRSLDVSKELQRTVAGPVTVKFAILGNGQPAYFQVLTHLRDGRIAEAIWRAVAACRWVPGADPSGQPVSIWVVVPFKFEQS
jgi:outer membrane biosynthesis protein TonB